MKLFIVLCAMVAVSCAVPASKYNKQNDQLLADFSEFFQCINVNEAAADIQDALQNNAGVKKIVQYLLTDDFKKAVEGIDAEESYRALLSDLEDQGIPAYEAVNEILKAFNITPIPVPPTDNDGTLDDLLDKLEKTIDLDCFEKKYQELLTRNEFKTFDDHVHSDDFKKIVTTFKASEGLKKAIAEFHSKGLDLTRVVKLWQKIFHWDF